MKKLDVRQISCKSCPHKYNHITEEPCCECKPEGKRECANE